jgi:hypothetical protein
LKEFHQLNDYKPTVCIYNSKTGDIIEINKGFINGLQDEEIESNSETNKFEFLANDLTVDNTDFSDPASLLRRQRKLLERINIHMNQTKFDPLRILRKMRVLWMLIICHGGKFVLQELENGELKESKTESKYVCRGK